MEDTIIQNQNEISPTAIQFNLNAVINKMGNISVNANKKVLYRLQQPIESYKRETFPKLQFKNEFIKRRIYNYLSEKETNKDIKIEAYKIDEIVGKLMQQISKSLKETGYFPELSTKECRYLFLSDKIFLDSTYNLYKNSFTTYMNQKQEIKGRVFKALLTRYFKSFNALQNDDSFMTMLKNCFNKYYSKTQNVPNSLKSFKEENLLSNKYCEHVATKCIKESLNQNIPIKDIISKKYKLIVPSMDIHNEIMKEMGLICFKNIKEQQYLEVLLNEILTFDFKKSQMDELVSKVIMIFGKDNIKPDIQNQIQRSIIKNPKYGDPRLNKLNWSNIEPKARQIFISWLAKEDLEFFFNIMFKNSTNGQGRKGFWEQYINSDELLYSKVILSNEAATYSAVKEAEKEGRTFARFRSSADNSSCFILAFKTANIVEFSESGNAVYFYNVNDNILRMDKMVYPKVSDLKRPKTPESTKTNLIMPDINETPCFRVRHIDGWQQKVKGILSRSLSIYPGERK